MNVFYHHLQSEDLIILKFTGIIEFNSYEKNIRKFADFVKLHKIKRALYDYRTADVSIFFKYEKELFDIREKLEIAISAVYLVDTPALTAVIQLYQSRIEELGLIYRLCCTYEQAIEWLNLKMSPMELNTLLLTMDQEML
jgi:hypothetical protein